MDEKQIVTIVVTVIVTGVIAPFSKTIFDKIFAAYNPDPKKIGALLLKIGRFALMYLTPIANLIFIIVSSEKVDKVFVVLVAFTFSSLVFNVLGSFLINHIHQLNKIQLEHTQKVAKLFLSNTKEISEKNTEILKSIIEAQDKHLNITQKLIEKDSEELNE